jgi:hypothetical protein
MNPLRPLSAIALLSIALPAPSQEPGAPPPQPAQGADAGEAKREMIELFQKIETKLEEIDALLYDASTGEPGARGRLAGVGEAGIGELLQRSQDNSQEVLAGIDRILEIARQFGQSQGGSGGSCEAAMKPGESPLDHEPGSPTTREQTPELAPNPGQRPQPEPSGQQPVGQQPRDPRDGVEPPGDPQNRDATSEPPGSETGRVEVEDTSERWGDLPVHVRDLFRTEGSHDMPPQYRDWIDGYYRRLNRRP